MNRITRAVLASTELTTDFPPSLAPNAFGETRVVYPKTGVALHRLSWQTWSPYPGMANFADVRVGSDHVPRYLVQTTLTSAKIYDLAQPICHQNCQQNECGPDGCGGNCGVCANCAGCGEDGHCIILPSERIAPQPGGGGAGNAALPGAWLMPDGQILAGPAYGPHNPTESEDL